MSMNPEQIRALRSEAADSADSSDSIESPELGPPPMSHFIDEDPVKVDSPSRPYPAPTNESPKLKMEPPVTLESPQSNKFAQRSPSPEKRKAVPEERKEEKLQSVAPVEAPITQPAKTGLKRKLAARDDFVTAKPQLINNENQSPRILAGKQSIRDRVGNKSLKELATTRKETSEKTSSTTATRKPLAARSTNDDVSSPKKAHKPVVTDEITSAKANLVKLKASVDRSKPRTKTPTPVVIEPAIEPPTAPQVADITATLGTPITEPAILSPSSPETAGPKDSSRGGTPPPIDINANRDPPRPSRRNRTAVSYAEPNLRDKMRRPTKELYDAVTGEGKYSRRSSNVEMVAPGSATVKKEDELSASWKQLPPAPAHLRGPDDIPASPLAGKGSSPTERSQPTPREKGRRTSTLIQESLPDAGVSKEEEMDKTTTSASADSSNASEVDIYEFTTSSPQPEKEVTRKKTGGRRASRRVSSAVTSEDNLPTRERASRRRSMML